MLQQSVGVKIGVILGVIHFILVALASLSAYRSHSSTAGLVFIWFGFLDAPLSVILPRAVLMIGGPFFFYGVLGSALWFIMPLAIDKLLCVISSKIPSNVRGVIIFAVLPVLVIKLFVPLSFHSAQSFVQSERPEALKSSLGKASSDFLVERPVFEDANPGAIDVISFFPCRENHGQEIAVSMRQNVVFLNEAYQEQGRITFQTASRAPRITPVPVRGGSSCLYLAETFQTGVALYNDTGKELWSVDAQPSTAGAPAAGPAADINGDGKPEVVLFYSYRDGIKVMDVEGKELWNHPIHALGHVDLLPSIRDSAPSIIFDNSNNANGTTNFTTLAKDGAITSEVPIQTKSYEFAVIPWPAKDGGAHLLLTEDERIRIVTLDGQTVSEMSAPGCKEFGTVRARLVKFRKDEPDYLAVKKSLHPDLSVLYVYSPKGQLVYQKTEVVMGILQPTMAVVPSTDLETEKLLIGAPYGPHATVLEYSPKTP